MVRSGSIVDDARLQPPFVTASGLVVLVTDAMDVTVLPDPATLAPGAPWAPAFVFDAAKYKPLPNTTTYVLAGACLGADDTLYIVDGFSRAVRALALTASGVAELPGSPVVFKTSTRFQFPGTASLLLIADPGGDQLWVPLIGVLGGTAGAAVVIATAAFAGPAPEPAFVPLPGSCVFPLDQGSAALTGRLDFEEDVTGAVLLGSFDCGALATHVDTATGYPSTMWASPPLAFAFGEGHRDAHAHPVFDAPSSSVVFVDYSARYGAPAQLCCARAADWGYCAGWSVTCVNIPSMAYDPDTQMITPWDWIATAVSEDGVAFVAASGRALVNNSHTHSVLVAFSLTGGAVLALLRVATDMFNSAPLVVAQPAGASRVFLSTTKGGVFCYSADSIASGPVWTTYGEVGRPRARLGNPLPRSTRESPGRNPQVVIPTRESPGRHTPTSR